MAHGIFGEGLGMISLKDALADGTEFVEKTVASIVLEAERRLKAKKPVIRPANDNIKDDSINAETLLGMDFAPLEYVIPGYVVEGLTVLGGNTHKHEGLSMLLAIETGGSTVALAEGDDVVERLNTDRLLRDTVRCLKRGGQPLWNGVTEFSSRDATPAEQADFRHWQATA
jgi:hypothetical protein